MNLLPDDFMRHPIGKFNRDDEPRLQAEQLAGLPNEERHFMAKVFRIGNAAYCYCNRLASEPTGIDFAEWLEGLTYNSFRNQMIADGFEKSSSVWSFRRSIQEKNDIGMDEFMQQHLSLEAYVFHQESSRT